MNSTKHDEERQIFLLFAAAANLAVEPETVQQPDPPDITCVIAGLGEVAFELTQIDDQGELRRMTLFLRNEEFFHSEFSALELTARDRVERDLQDAVIWVHFRDEADQRRRREVFRRIIRALKAHPRFAGNLKTTLGDCSKSVVHAYLERHDGMQRGPRVRCPSAGWVQPVDLTRVTKKVAGERYQQQQRIELLAYVRWGDAASSDARNLAIALEKLVVGSSFSRAWIFEVASRKVVATYDQTGRLLRS